MDSVVRGRKKNKNNFFCCAPKHFLNAFGFEEPELTLLSSIHRDATLIHDLCIMAHLVKGHAIDMEITEALKKKS